MSKYIKHINNLGGEHPKYVKTSLELPFKEMENLSIGNSFNILNELQRDYHEGNYLHLETYLKDRLNDGFVDHGIISALLLLKTSDILYLRKWPHKKKIFENTFHLWL
ncbi:hypothetical protein KO465_08935 [Candidatus Micrarchaeota archaeon]|nr:hypothetical protein [Candidatus Micrarchaeota archaeon]